MEWLTIAVADKTIWTGVVLLAISLCGVDATIDSKYQDQLQGISARVVFFFSIATIILGVIARIWIS